MASCPEALGILKKSSSSDSTLEEGRRFSELVEARPVVCGGGAARSEVQMEKSA